MPDELGHRHRGPRDRDVDGGDDLAGPGADGDGDGPQGALQFLIVHRDAGAAHLRELGVEIGLELATALYQVQFPKAIAGPIDLTSVKNPGPGVAITPPVGIQ